MPKVYLVCILATTAKASLDSTVTRSSGIFTEAIAGAQFWTLREGSTNNTRIFQGEIAVAKRLKPSFHFPGPSLRVS
jgi:hypothetical protein